MHKLIRRMSAPTSPCRRWAPAEGRNVASITSLVRAASPQGPTTADTAPTTQPPITTPAPPPSTSPLQSPGGASVPAVPSASALSDLPFYSQFPLDRHAEWRRDKRKLDELFARDDAKLIPLMKDLVLVCPNTPDPSSSSSSTGTPPPALLPVLLSPACAHADLVASSPARVFLGTDAAGAPYFAAGVSSPAAAKDLAASHPGAEWRSARSAGPYLAEGDASLLAVASGLMVWHGSNGYSAVTGATTTASPGGFSRKCSAGGGSAYPRIDPAVIMLVTHGDYALLGRKAEWPADRYSTLAGFLEVGEPLEAAVARETEEEAGVRVDLASVSYLASQPWPFPRSLMIGFNARAAPASGPASSSSSPSTAAAADGTGTGSHGPTTTTTTTTTIASGGYSPPGGYTALASAAVWWRPMPLPARGFDLLPAQGRRAALDSGIFAEEVEATLRPLQELQWPVADVDELQDVRWFHRDWIRAVFRSPGGAFGILGAGQFNVPGPYSLAYRLITAWAGCTPAGEAGAAPGSGAAPPSTAESDVSAASGKSSTAASGSSISNCCDPWVGDVVPQVLISSSGTFKYVLLRLWDPRHEGGNGGREGRSKLLVWGDTRAPYHNDVLQKAKAMARPLGLHVSPLGGGRINHDLANKAIQVYGYSAAFGPAAHEVTAALLHRWFPLYDKDSITVSYEGY